MKEILLLLGASALLMGCGVSQKQLKETSELLQKGIDAPCEDVKLFLKAAKEAIDEKRK